MIEADVFNVAKIPTRGEMLARTERELQVSMCQLLEENLAAQRHCLSELKAINAKLGQGSSNESRSHVEVKTSARGVDVSSKAYADSSMDGLSDLAVQEYFATLEKVQARLNGAMT